jgi:hypothetical protein
VIYNYSGDPEARVMLCAGDAEVQAFIAKLANDTRVAADSIGMGEYLPAQVNVKPPRMLEAEVTIAFGQPRKKRSKPPVKKAKGPSRKKDAASNGTLPLNLDPPGQ